MRTYTKVRDLKPGESQASFEMTNHGIHGAMQHIAMFSVGRDMKENERGDVIAFEIETRVIVHRVVGKNEVELWNEPPSAAPASKEGE